MSLAAVPLALVLDAVVGDPDRLWRRTGHPVTWFGAAIATLDDRLNRGRRRDGIVALGLALAVFAIPAALLAAILEAVPGGIALEAFLAATLLAHRSLHDHVAAVADAASLEAARTAVARIVGRETAALDDSGVATAALETLGENLSDGVVAPALWFALAGLPGLVAYKVINTADSMIGHRTERHRAFGWAAARADDLANLVPARLTALLVAFASPRNFARGGWRTVLVDAPRHVSPNAGWPESALAAALGVAFGGPRCYGERVVEGAWLNAGGRPATRADIRRGLAVSLRVGLLHVALYAALVLV